MKGQSAVEYIVTYGWAILALLIVIGVLMTSGIFNPSFVLSEECNVGTNLPCNFALFNEEGSTKLGISLHNGFQYPIKLHEMAIEDPSTGEGFQLESSRFGEEVKSGDDIDIIGTYEGEGLPDDSYQRYNLTVLYSSCAPELEPSCGPKHKISGRISGKVIAEE